MEMQRTQNGLKNEKEEKFEGLTLCGFNTYYKTVIKKLWFGHKDNDKKQNGVQKQTHIYMDN